MINPFHPHTKILLLIGKIRERGSGLTSLGRGGGLRRGRWQHSLAQKLRREVRYALEVESVEELEREDDLLELHLAIHPLEYTGSTSHRQIRVLVRQVRPLHRDVAVVAKVEAVDGLVPVAFLLRLVLDQYAYSGGYAGPFLQVPGVNLQQSSLYFFSFYFIVLFHSTYYIR